MEILVLVLILLVIHETNSINVYSDQTEFVQQKTGQDIKIECRLKNLLSQSSDENTGIEWYFKHCLEIYHFGCSASEENWVKLPCDNSFCKSDLILRNITINYSGFYKCTTVSNKLSQTFLLDVKTAPEFIDDNPENKTALIDSKVIFQCRVKSIDPATIKWFRRIKNASSKSLNGNGNGHSGSHMLPYNGFVYELLDSGGEKVLGRSSYYSKLILNSVKKNDEGFYACVAISYRGHKIREAYLKILDDENEQWLDYDIDEDSSDTSKFWLLFLIPLGLAILPLIVWLLCIVLKTSHDNKALTDNKVPFSEHVNMTE